MKKDINLVFTPEEAEILITVFSAYQESVNTLQMKVPAVDIDFKEANFITESLHLLNDAIALNFDVVLQCNYSLQWLLYSLAIITASYSTEENDSVNTSCIIKLLHAAQSEVQ